MWVDHKGKYIPFRIFRGHIANRQVDHLKKNKKKLYYYKFLLEILK